MNEIHCNTGKEQETLREHFTNYYSDIFTFISSGLFLKVTC